MNGGGLNYKDINAYGKGQGGDLIDTGMGAYARDGAIETLDRFRHYRDYNNMEHMDGGMMLEQGHFSEYGGGLFDGMALSSEFLGKYYSNVSTQSGERTLEWNGTMESRVLSRRLILMFRLVFICRNPTTQRSSSRRRTLCWCTIMRVKGLRQALWGAAAFTRMTMIYLFLMTLALNSKPWLRSVGDQPL